MGATWIAVSPDVPIEYNYYICHCTDHGGPFADCVDCNGIGAIALDHTAGEMHLTYGNTHALMAALGFPVDPEAYVGDLTYEQVVDIAKHRIHNLQGDLRERYWSPLSTLCAVALRYKCGICWG
jgi:hypothetical protein